MEGGAALNSSCRAKLLKHHIGRLQINPFKGFEQLGTSKQNVGLP